jgi:Asp-tRNA(Asn)/Glu-tRNA(Gln) amidotransferase A subunit family amidase
LHPVTRQVFENAVARQSTAIDLFRDFHKQAECKRIAEEMFKYEDDLSDGKRKITLMVVPTAPFHPTIEEVEKDPIDMNTRLGAFAHFANVLDLTAIAVPCGTYEVGDVNGIEGKKAMLPFGVTILAGYELDAVLLEVVNGLEDVLRDAADLDDSDSG